MSSRISKKGEATALVADDDETIRLLARRVLEDLGLAVKEARNGIEALRCIESDGIDLVLLDVEMPEHDGFEVCERIRESVRCASTPVIMLTGRDDLESIQRAYAVGATDFVVKPVNWTILAQRIAHVLQSSRAFSELANSRKKLSESQRIARLGNWELDPESREVAGSDEFFRIYGLDEGPRPVDFETWMARLSAAEAERLRPALESALEQGTGFGLDHTLVDEEGSEQVIHIEATVRLSDDREGGTVDGIAQDVTERREADAQIRQLAYHDSLTGLGNQWLLRERLENAVALCRRDGGTLALLVVGLDDIQRIDDTLGRPLGDRVVELAASRLVGSIRSVDSVARVNVHDDAAEDVSCVGRGEFTVLLTRIRDAHSAALVAQRILDLFFEPIDLDFETVLLGARIGIAIGPVEGEGSESVIRNASAAMHQIRQDGRRVYQFFDDSTNHSAERRFRLERDLRDAIRDDARNELSVRYQPKVRFETRAIAGMETLVRWQHPNLGMISPNEFIPIAEEAGIIGELGIWILRTACMQTRAWHRAGFDGLRVAVNLSAYELADPDLPAMVLRTLQETQLPPGSLELEVTETALIRSHEASSSALSKIKAIGVHVALDDFGTGYSSLSHLKQFPIDVVKIDRSFIAELESSASDAAIVRAILSMAKALDLEVVAEGVETVMQREFLAEHGCDLEQGFLFSRPLDTDAFSELLESTILEKKTA